MQITNLTGSRVPVMKITNLHYARSTETIGGPSSRLSAWAAQRLGSSAPKKHRSGAELLLTLCPI